MKCEQGLQPLGGFGAGVHHFRVGLDSARDRLEQRHRAEIRINDGLEHEQQRVGIGIRREHHFLFAHPDRHPPRLGAYLADEVAETIHRHRASGRAAHHREHGSGSHALAEHRLQSGQVGHFAFQILFQEVVIGHHDAFHQSFVHFLLLGFHALGDFAFFAFSAVVDPRLVGEQVSDAVKFRAFADGELQRGHA